VSDFILQEKYAIYRIYSKNSYLLSLGKDFLTLGECVRGSLSGTEQRARASKGLAGSKGTSSSGEQSSDSDGKLHGRYVCFKTVRKEENELYPLAKRVAFAAENPS